MLKTREKEMHSNYADRQIGPLPLTCVNLNIIRSLIVSLHIAWDRFTKCELEPGDEGGGGGGGQGGGGGGRQGGGGGRGQHRGGGG